ncbi:MAG TPA: beta-ketoacyl synthase N-terminal-like domain-containing protein, partial [Herpetosiphonaceae bacterium]|nr:beta-ketoacyl synthase N-terminal-like domain-containing protein [Herpetosiphonaceae bacterium]
MEQRVVITGLGVCSALGNDCESFWRALAAGESGIRPLPELASGEAAVVGGAAPNMPQPASDKANRRQPDRMIQ